MSRGPESTGQEGEQAEVKSTAEAKPKHELQRQLELANLTHRYGDELAVENVSLGLEAGEVVALLGPSGCGKTTLVQAIAGHVRPTVGRVRLRGEDVTDTPPEARDLGVVFQQSTLFPHLTVGENVAYGLAADGIEPSRRAELVTHYLELVGLLDQRGAAPSELSGGQQRRVELARALAPGPDVLVLDEPLSALDRALSVQLRGEIARIQRETGVTTLLVTHDQTTAMALADRLVVMTGGRVAGRGRPRELYESPPNPFVASFLGRSNELSGTLFGSSPPTVELGGETIVLDECVLESSAQPLSSGTAITCYLRPDTLSIRSGGGSGVKAEAEAKAKATAGARAESKAKPAPSDSAALPGTVLNRADLGRHYDVTVELETGEKLLVEQSSVPPAVGDRVTVGVQPDRIHVFKTA